MAGLELKRELVAGDLGDPRRAALPVAATLGGTIAPALIYLIVNPDARDGALQGWAIPVATDIAFALAVLAVVSRHLTPPSFGEAHDAAQHRPAASAFTVRRSGPAACPGSNACMVTDSAFATIADTG